MDKQEIRDKSSQDNSNILLLEKGKRGALNVIFGRTMLIVVLILTGYGIVNFGSFAKKEKIESEFVSGTREAAIRDHAGA